MAKRSLTQIQESLAEQFYKYRRRGDDLGPEMGGGSFGLGSVTRSPSQFGGGSSKVQKPATPTPPAAPPANKPRVQMKPGETQDQAMLRIQREKIAKDRNAQAGAKVWRPGESKPKVWRRGSEEKGTGNVPSGRKPPGKEPPVSAGPSSRSEIPGETKWAKRRAAAGSAGVHAIAAGLLAGALSKDKEAGGSVAAADDSGVTWVDTADFVPTDTTAKDIQEPKSSAAAPREPAQSPEEPIADPEIRLEPVTPLEKPDVTKPQEKPAEPEVQAPKKDQKVPVTEPVPAPSPTPSTKTVPTDGGSRGETNKPSIRPKDQPGTTPGGKGSVSSPDGAGPAPGERPGSDTGPGQDFKYNPSNEILMRETQLQNKYQHFLNEETAKEKFLQRVIGPESGGRPEIKNPLSPATGLFQFMPRTWAGVVAKAKPGDAHYGVSFKDMPQNVAAQRAAAKQIADEYAQTIKRTGMPDIPTSYYLLHGHGPKAVEIYKNPNKQLKDIYPEYVKNKQGQMVKNIVYTQNPNFKPEQRLVDFVAARAKKMGDRLTDVFPTATAGELPREAPVQSTKKSKATKSAEKADTVIKQEPVEQKPIGTIVQPDYSKYKVGDLGPLEKIGPGQWRSTSTGKTVTDAPELENLPAVPRPETFLDKVKRTLPPSLGGGGELVSQVFGDKKKTAAAPNVTDKQPAKDPAYEPGTAEYDARMEKLQIAAGDKFSREREARLKATAEKPADKKIELQRDQAGLVKAKRELSDFERAFAAARAEQGAGGTFTWTDPRTGKTDTYGTLYKGEKPPSKTVSAVPADQALSKGEELVDIPVAQAKDRFQPTASTYWSAPAKSEIQQALKDFDRTQERKQERKQDIDRVIQQLADVPAATPAPRTPEELASDELWKDIRASVAGKSSEEISAAAQRAKQELDTAIAADQTVDATASKPYREPIELPGIELKEPTEPYVAPIDVPIDSEEQTRRQAAKDAAQDEMKESINTTSRADLHDILRLAGRLK